MLPDGSCQCKENFYGPTCDGVDYDLVCDQALVSVKVKMSIFESIGIDSAENLHLNDMACQERIEIALFLIPFDSTNK